MYLEYWEDVTDCTVSVTTCQTCAWRSTTFLQQIFRLMVLLRFCKLTVRLFPNINLYLLNVCFTTPLFYPTSQPDLWFSFSRLQNNFFYVPVKPFEEPLDSFILPSIRNILCSCLLLYLSFEKFTFQSSLSPFVLTDVIFISIY